MTHHGDDDRDADRSAAVRGRCAVVCAVAFGALLLVTAAPALASAPDPPTTVTALAADGEAFVSFAAPASDGGYAIAGYTVTASPGGAQTGGSATTIAVTGLTDGTTYTFTVTATNSNGETSPGSLASAPVTPLAAPRNTSAATVTGTAQVDDKLTATTGTWNESPLVYTYQWSDCDPQSNACTAIPGATASTYTVEPFDGGAVIAVTLTATNIDQESTTYTSETGVVDAAAGTPTVVTAPTVGAQAGPATRTGTAGTWTNDPTSYTYQWVRCEPDTHFCYPIGTDQPSYTPSRADAGWILYLEVYATNAYGDSLSATSDPSLIVSYAAPPLITITTPADGADYVPSVTNAQVTTVAAEYQCSAPIAMSVTSCVGTVKGGAQLPFAFGDSSFTVTATDADGQSSTKTVNYTIGGPLTVTVASPVNGATYLQGAAVPATFSCAASDGAVLNCSGAQTPGCPANVLAENLGPNVACAGLIPSGGFVDTTNLGQHTATFTAYATYGGLYRPPATVTLTYEVVAPPAPQSTAGSSPAGPTVQGQRLVVTDLRQSTTTWRLSATKKASARVPVGTRFSFSSDVAARVTFAFSKVVAGRADGGRCVAPTSHNARHAGCARLLSAGSIVIAGGSGANTVPFSGAVGSTKLAVGAYSATVTATAGGVHVKVGTLHFTIVK